MASNRTIMNYSLLLFCLHSLVPVLFSHAIDTIRPNDMLRDNQTLVSAGGMFELGFFTDGFSGYQYLGIWFKDDGSKKAIWVANRNNPILDSPGILQIRYDGNLVLVDKQNVSIIVNLGVLAISENTSATLLDYGNFVLREGEIIIWQSFDYPTDTYLPGMKLGWFGLSMDNPRRQFLASWVSPQNPTSGAFTLGIDNNGLEKLSVWHGESAHMDIGFWDGQSFKFIFQNSSNSCNFSYISNENESYFIFSTNLSYDFSWIVMASTGQLDEYTMMNGKISMVNHSLCEDSVGSNTTRYLTSMPSMCRGGDKFSVLDGMLPTSSFASNSLRVGFNNCEIMCQSNCSCTAFAYLQDDQSECQLYYGSKNDLLDVKERGKGIIYVRGDAPTDQDSGSRWKLWLTILGPVSSILAPIFVSLFCYYWRGRKCNLKGNQVRSQNDMSRSDEMRLVHLVASITPIDEVISENKLELGRQKEQELPLFRFSTLETATNNFAMENKLGQGGFGPVYKGKFQQGQEIAVKRLSKLSHQGLQEFINEVTLISKLQHRNLVRILGCCIEGEESILIYEYMPNKSLDSFIFDSAKQALLDWRKRVNIIEGIAQGLLYLHKFSRLKIIHRDLKTSNILLDGDMNPKISDFGMARIFKDNENRATTNRIVGTYGYMSPEYAMDGLFSEKSDVFSFGVILLEIISGKKNVSFYQSDHSLNLLGYAWTLWKDGKSMEFMDSTLYTSCSASKILRCIQLGLLCVQERASDRPTMSDVVSMLSTEILALPTPKEPAFLTRVSSVDSNSHSNRQQQCSINYMTTSEVHAR